MELVLSRRKKRGMMGGISFEVHAKLRLRDSETAAIREGGFGSA
jgi:hypothetical protein